MALNLRDPRLPKEVVNDCAPKVGYEKFSCINFKQLNANEVSTNYISSLTAGQGVRIPFTFQNNITAGAGGGLSNATQLGRNMMNYVTTVASSGDSVVLPAATIDNIGEVYTVSNVAPSENELNVYVPAGHTLDGLTSHRSISFSGGFSFIVVAENTYLTAGIDYFPDFQTTKTGITAFAGGGQGSATTLSAIGTVYIVSTVASDGDSVKFDQAELLGTPSAKRYNYVYNAGANTLDVFPYTGHDIGAGVNTAVQVHPGQTLLMFETGSGTGVSWIIEQPKTTADSLTAFAGGGIGSATQIPLNQLTSTFGTVASAGDSAKLPAEKQPGVVYTVINDGVNAMDLFPASASEDIGAGAGNAVSISNSGFESFVSLGGGNFRQLT